MAAPRVLIVDDEPDVLEICARTLRTQDFEVITASDVRTAKILLQAQAVDLLVTDIRMPVEDGISLLHAVHDTTPDLPLMVITGYPDHLPSIYAALNLNVRSFLPDVKTITVPTLLVQNKNDPWTNLDMVNTYYEGLAVEKEMLLLQYRGNVL